MSQTHTPSCTERQHDTPPATLVAPNGCKGGACSCMQGNRLKCCIDFRGTGRRVRAATRRAGASIPFPAGNVSLGISSCPQTTNPFVPGQTYDYHFNSVAQQHLPPFYASQRWQDDLPPRLRSGGHIPLDIGTDTFAEQCPNWDTFTGLLKRMRCWTGRR